MGLVHAHGDNHTSCGGKGGDGPDSRDEAGGVGDDAGEERGTWRGVRRLAPAVTEPERGSRRQMSSAGLEPLDGGDQPGGLE